MTVIATLASGLDFPEGPSVAPDGAIWVSELRGGRIARVAPGDQIRRYEVGGVPNGTAVAVDGSIWFCDAAGGRICRLDPASGACTTVVDRADGKPLDAPNDLAFHPDGSLAFTCPGESRSEPTGYICRLSGAHARRIADGLLFPNGICFSAEGETVHVAETYGCRVLSARWSERLDLKTIMATPGPIGADGVAVASDGRLHTTVYGGGLVRSCAANGTDIVDTLVPDSHPAGCCIDPLRRWPLIVTGTERGRLFGVAP